MFPQVCLFVTLLAKCYGYQNSWGYDYNRYQIPEDVMTDVVNNLALKLLAIHNEGNDNNIAISPYGAVSVLVALKEGLQGTAAEEIHRAAGIPSDVSVVRIGLRDIHRHLKSYFIPEEGFLSGLTLSHDNVTLNREYEDILRFYGFDINSFNNGLYPDFDVTETTTSMSGINDTTTEMLTSTTTEVPKSTIEVMTTEQIFPKEENNEVTSTLQTTTDMLTTTESARITRSEPTTSTEILYSSTIMDKDTTVITITGPETTKAGIAMETTSTTESSESTMLQTVSTATETSESPNEITTTESTLTSNIVTNSNMPTYVTELTSTTTDTTTEVSTTLDIGLSTEIKTSKSYTENKVKISETTTEILDELTDSTSVINMSDLNDTVDEETENSAEMNMNLIDNTTNSEQLNEETTEYSDEFKDNDTIRRNTRSVVDYIIARYYDDHAITQRPPPYNLENDLYFLINGNYKETNINYMTYDTVLPFFYISHLQTLALRFPLDSSKYYLLLLLPENPNQINRLICDLRLNSSLKYIIDNLRYTHVKAIIPSFMLKGYVILTQTFQKMGMYRVFEPRQADFSPMTSDRGIYVTNIEQAITVNIRNYVDPATMNNNNKHLHRTNPVLFRADHPFLYFVIDSEIDITLMAGKVVNPLNSRIR